MSGGSAVGGRGAGSAAAGMPSVGGAAGSGVAGAATGGGGAASSAGSGGSGIVYPFEPQGPPFATKADLFKQDSVDTLGLAKAPGTETASIFKPTDSTDKFCNGVVLTAFKGYLYAQWQSSPKDEDSTDTWTAYSRSQDGKTWSAPLVLAAKSSDQRASGGWTANAAAGP